MPSIVFLLYQDFIKPSVGIGLFGVIVGAIWKLFTDSKIERTKSEFNKDIAKLNSRLDKKKESSLHVFKSKFDLEIKIFQEVWSAVFELRDKTIGLAPVRDSAPFPEDESDFKRRMEKRYSAHIVAFNEALTISMKNQPFIPKDIAVEVSKLIEACRKEGGRFKLVQQSGVNNLSEQKERIGQEIETSFFSIEKLIRERINDIKIIEEDD